MADVVFSSSGSTGAAKRIVRTEERLQADARNLVAAFPEVWAARPPVVASVRPEHMFGALWCVRAPAVAECTVDSEIVLSVEALVAAQARHGRFLFVTTPSFLEKALHHPVFAALKGAFHAIVTAGSALRPETAQALVATVGVCPLEIYGSTEAGTVAFRYQTRETRYTLVPGVSARVTDDGRLAVDSPFAEERPWVMDDCAEMVSDLQFDLKGRVDRRVKILEQFVSLSEVEAALAAHPAVARVRVETYGDGVTRLGALIVPSEAGLKDFAEKGAFTVAKTLRDHLRTQLPELAIPRRLRLVRELPTNEQGKTTAAAVQAALAAWCREPAVVSWQATADELKAELVFPSDTECFQGHFPGFPILPGVAQLYFVRHFARQAFADWPRVPTICRLKFQKVVLPGRPVTLTVTRKAPASFSFALVGTNGPCSSGIMEETVK